MPSLDVHPLAAAAGEASDFEIRSLGVEHLWVLCTAHSAGVPYRPQSERPNDPLSPKRFKKDRYTAR